MTGHIPASPLECVVMSGALREVEGFLGCGSAGGVDQTLADLVLDNGIGQVNHPEPTTSSN